jgi:hypothetical protein
MSDEIRQDEIEEPDVRPWEQPGTVRRDCESHRGPLLLFGGRVFFVLSLLGVAFSRIDPLPTGWLPLLALVGGAVCLWLSWHDLQQMKRGEMDPAGLTEVETARGLARYAIVFGLLTLGLSWGGVAGFCIACGLAVIVVAGQRRPVSW